MRLPYRRYPASQPVYPLGGAQFRDYPICDLGIETPGGSTITVALLDTGADDTILPATIAQALGLDLSNAPFGDAQGVGGSTLRCQYAQVKLRLSDGVEHCEWPATVGFVPSSCARPSLGAPASFSSST